MGEFQFNVSNLQEVDNGKAALMINHELRNAVRDVTGRPNDKTARRVHVLFEIAPILDRDSGSLDTVGVTVKATTKLPNRQTASYPMIAARDGTLKFQSSSPFDPRQRELPGLGGQHEENAGAEAQDDTQE